MIECLLPTKSSKILKFLQYKCHGLRYMHVMSHVRPKSITILILLKARHFIVNVRNYLKISHS